MLLAVVFVVTLDLNLAHRPKESLKKSRLAVSVSPKSGFSVKEESFIKAGAYSEKAEGTLQLASLLEGTPGGSNDTGVDASNSDASLSATVSGTTWKNVNGDIQTEPMHAMVVDDLQSCRHACCDYETCKAIKFSATTTTQENCLFFNSDAPYDEAATPPGDFLVHLLTSQAVVKVSAPSQQDRAQQLAEAAVLATKKALLASTEASKAEAVVEGGAPSAPKWLTLFEARMEAKLKEILGDMDTLSTEVARVKEEAKKASADSGQTPTDADAATKDAMEAVKATVKAADDAASKVVAGFDSAGQAGSAGGGTVSQAVADINAGVGEIGGNSYPPGRGEKTTAGDGSATTAAPTA